MKWWKHDTAITAENIQIGVDTKIWHFSHIREDVHIGKNCSLGQNVYIGKGVRIGNGVKIQNNVSVYEEVILEDGVFCGPSVVFTNVYNPRAFIERKDEFQTTLVKCGASLGANSTIICGNSIGEYAFVGAGAVVSKNIPNFALVVGVPAKQVAWISRYGERISLSLEEKGIFECKYSGDIYEMQKSHLKLIKQGDMIRKE